jgi:predicted Zn finger-like uncharacterized protein
MFQVDNNYIKAVGSKVRCSKCHEIFMAFPPDHNTESGSKGGISNSDEAVVIPKVKHSLLDDLFQVESIPTEMAISAGKCEKPDNSSNERIEPKEDSEEVAEDENIEYADLPDLSEIEKIVDSILDERDHLSDISPHIQARYSLTQNLNFSRA